MSSNLDFAAAASELIGLYVDHSIRVPEPLSSEPGAATQRDVFKRLASKSNLKLYEQGVHSNADGVDSTEDVAAKKIQVMLRSTVSEIPQLLQGEEFNIT